MGEKSMEVKCTELIDIATVEAFSSQHFSQIKKSTLKRIVERNTLEVAEIDVFNSCLIWAKAECGRQELEVCKIDGKIIPIRWV